MRLNTSLLVAAAIGLILGFSTDSRAQTTSIEGDIVVIQPGGAKEPAANVLIELYRLDVKGRYETRTDKRGHFAHIGLPFGFYAILISGEGLTPYYEYNVPIRGMPVQRTIEMLPGDGHRPTLEEIQKAAAMARSGQGPQLTAEQQRKQMEEQQKQMAEQKAKAARDEDLIKHFKLANELAAAGKYDEALPEYKAAMESSPDHPQLYVVLGKMAEVYHNMGVERFNRKERTSAADAFNLAIETERKAISLIPETKADEKPNYQSLLCRSLAVVASYLDQSKLNDAVAAHEALMAVQTSPADKGRTQNQLAKMYLDTARSEEAVAAFRKALAIDPNSLDAMFGLGQALVQPGDPSKYPEALSTLKDFVERGKSDQQRAAQVQQANEMIGALNQFVEEQKQDKGKKKKP